MSNHPLVSVLMPCYNAMPFLTEALDSIINQTYSNLEIICINDGSTDETGQILEEYAKHDNRIKVVHNQQNIQLIRSLNKGIDLATGEFIARMDADDISELNRIEIQLNYLIQNVNIDIISTSLTTISEEGAIIGEEVVRQTSPLSCLYSSFFFVPFHHGPMMVKTAVFKENHFLDKPHVLHTEDYELFSRLLAQGIKVQNLKEKLYKVRINSKSVSRKYTEIQDKNFVECARLHNQKFNSISMPFEVQEILVNRINRDKLNVKLLKNSIKVYRACYDKFIQDHPELSDLENQEIKTIYFTHLFDILVQSFKQGKLSVRLFVLSQFNTYCRILFSKKNLHYIKTKRVKN